MPRVQGASTAARVPWTVRYRLLVFVGWLILAVVAAPFAARVTHHLTSTGFTAPHSSAQWADSQSALLRPPSQTPPTLAQGIGLAGGKTRRHHRQTHHLFLKQRYSQSAFQHLPHRQAGVTYGLVALAPSQVGVNHAALNGAGADNGHFNDQVVITTGFQPRQHGHLGP